MCAGVAQADRRGEGPEPVGGGAGEGARGGPERAQEHAGHARGARGRAAHQDEHGVHRAPEGARAAPPLPDHYEAAGLLDFTDRTALVYTACCKLLQTRVHASHRSVSHAAIALVAIFLYLYCTSALARTLLLLSSESRVMLCKLVCLNVSCSVLINPVTRYLYGYNLYTIRNDANYSNTFTL